MAASLVIKQCATSVASDAKVLMEHPQWLTDLVFIVIEEGEGRKHHVVWQIVAFQEATQKVVTKRVSEHENIEMAEETSFPLSTGEVLIAPTLPFLDRMLTAMGQSRDAVLANSRAYKHLDSFVWQMEPVHQCHGVRPFAR
jgi:hypothetical protein